MRSLSTTCIPTSWTLRTSAHQLILLQAETGLPGTLPTGALCQSCSCCDTFSNVMNPSQKRVQFLGEGTGQGSGSSSQASFVSNFY